MADSPLYPRDVLRERGVAPVASSRARVLSGVRLVVDSWRRRPGPRRFLKVLSVLMLASGVVLFAYPFYTNYYADRLQTDLSEEFQSPQARTAYLSRTISPGDALTRIVIPKLDVDSIVVEGTTPSALRAGSGHYVDTSLPCEPGNVAIAGHRTTYSKPFANTNDLRLGDTIVLETPIGKCWYELSQDPWITHPRDWGVVQPLDGAWLTLTTCNPPGSAAERLVVRAKLVRLQFFTNDAATGAAPG